MELINFTYLGILIATLAVPLIFIADKNIQYYKNLKYIFPAILVTAACFLIWDIRFTAAQVWSFNFEYTLGITFKGLPIEEWLFFLVIPYSCVFLYEGLKVGLARHEYANFFLAFSLILMVGFALISYFFRHQGYTFITFLLSAVYLGYIVFRNKFKQHITMFYFSFFAALVPFLIVDGILTSLPVLEYNPAYIINIRILTIPVEDFSYFFLLLLMVITIYETLKESRYY